jgi:hypothetical protein
MAQVITETKSRLPACDATCAPYILLRSEAYRGDGEEASV